MHRRDFLLKGLGGLTILSLMPSHLWAKLSIPRAPQYILHTELLHTLHRDFPAYQFQPVEFTNLRPVPTERLFRSEHVSYEMFLKRHHDRRRFFRSIRSIRIQSPLGQRALRAYFDQRPIRMPEYHGLVQELIPYLATPSPNQQLAVHETPRSVSFALDRRG